MQRWLLLLSLALSVGCLPAFAAPTAPRELVIFGAASLSNALGDISEDYQKSSGVVVKLSFASTSVLAKQIEAGAGADALVSADQEWMDYLQHRNLIDPSTRRNLVGNRLVLITAADTPIELEIAAGFPLTKALGARGRLATGDPESVPVGRYARSALTSLGVWNAIADRLVRADNVRTAMNFVARGEAVLGIVYTTDALLEPKVRIIDTFPDSTHLPITYPAAAVATARAGTKDFLAFLSSSKAQAVFRKYGFIELRR
jgi:molybdate transport system substrate-binding protein